MIQRVIIRAAWLWAHLDQPYSPIALMKEQLLVGVWQYFLFRHPFRLEGFFILY